ncbi:MAG: isoprenylcysteine carboxylmethyltransferase family protein [Patescibacteria group bacterium]
MGPAILIAVLLHTLSSYWQFRKQPKRSIRNSNTDISAPVRVVIVIKEYVILPIIVLALLLYSFDSKAIFWLIMHPLEVTWLEIVGLLLIVASIRLKMRAYAALGKNWAAAPTIHEDHSLVRAGPYAWVRHPVYTSNIIMLLGTFFATSSLALLMLGACYFVTDIVRGNVEEKQLALQFGESYAQYRSAVGKYVPRAVTLSMVGLIIVCNIIGIIDELLINLTGHSFTVSMLVCWLSW